MLGTGAGDTGDIRFLEGIVADEQAVDLTGKDDQRNGIHISRCQSGHRVGSPRTGSHEADPHLARRPGVTVGGVHRSLFVAHQKMTDLFRVFRQGVIQAQNRPAG